STPSTFALQAGETRLVDLAFMPSIVGTQSVDLTVDSNDPLTPSVSIELKGEVIDRITVLLNAFIPGSIAGLTKPAPAPFSGLTVIEGPEPLFQVIGALYETDQRSWSLDPNDLRSRMHSEISAQIANFPIQVGPDVERIGWTTELGQIVPAPY